MPRFTRTTALKLAYPTVLGAGLVGSVALMTVGTGGWGLLAAGVLLLTPGRIQAAACGDFLRGRRLMAEGDFAGSIVCSERFLTKIRARPALRHLVWLQWAAYSTSMEAMTLNNLGGARMGLGELDAAEADLREALRVDTRYPLPYYNLSLIATARGEAEEAERLLAEAHRLGMTDSRVDQFIQYVASGQARRDAVGAARPSDG